MTKREKKIFLTYMELDPKFTFQEFKKSVKKSHTQLVEEKAALIEEYKKLTQGSFEDSFGHNAHKVMQLKFILNKFHVVNMLLKKWHELE